MKKFLTFKTLGWVLISISYIFLIFSGSLKMMPNESSYRLFKSINLLDYVFFIGFAEFILANMLLYPVTDKFATVGLTFLLGAATMTHVLEMGGDGMLFPIFLLILIWSGYCLRKHFDK